MLKSVKKSTFPPLIHASDVTPEAMRWLWFPYIPLGTTTMIFGPGGIGKSHIVCEIAACVTTGRNLPGQPPVPARKPMNVLMLSAEDDLKVVLQPRLVAAGADLQRIYMPEDTFILDPKGIEQMEQYMHDCAATAVFIDPTVAYVGGRIDMNRMNEVRTFTGALARSARRTGTGVVIIHHSRKDKGGDDADRAAGSADFVNAVRSTLFAGRTPDGTRYLKHVKSNYAKEGPTLTYHFEDNKFSWTGIIDESLLIAPGRPKSKAVVWLRELLRDGPVPSNEIFAMAKDEGFSESTIKRAKDIVAESFIQHENGKNVWYWRLAYTQVDPIVPGTGS